ncbi:MAG TPA: hypothetical protein VK849_05145 [Longimicrobiales bacterium]|nr:hypothetical protein [Longimicrobiales bacterium]
MDAQPGPRTRTLTLLIALLLPITIGEAAAQACVGLPQGSAGALALSVAFPEDATTYGLGGATYEEYTDLVFTVGFALTKDDVDTGEDLKSVGGTFGWEVDALQDDVSLCPTVGLSYEWIADLNLLTVPLGVAVGRTFRLGRTTDAGLTPFAMPHFLWTRATVDDVEGSETDTFFAVSGGLSLNLGPFLFGGGVNKIFEEDLDPVYSVFVGAAWE